MEKMSLEKTKERFLTYLEANDFEKSIVFLEALILNSPKTSFYDAISLDLVELCLDYHGKLVQHIEKYNFKDKTEKNLHFNCFQKLYSIYKPEVDYEYYAHSATYSAKYGEILISKNKFIKSYFDFYFLTHMHCVVDEHYPEYIELKKEFEKIDEKAHTFDIEHDGGYIASWADPTTNLYDGPSFESFLTEKEINLKKLMTYHLDYHVNFHPFNGKLVNEIIKDTPIQFLDLLINLDHFCVPEFVLFDEKLIICDNFLKALTKNRIKKTYIIEQYKLNQQDKDSVYEQDYATSQESYDATDNVLKDNPISDAFDGDPSSAWNVE